MKSILSKIITNPFIVLITILDIPLSFISNLSDFISNKKLDIGFFENLKNTINMNYFEISIRIITVIFLFILWKQFLKEKEKSEKSRIYITTELTNNINTLSTQTHKKIKYLFLLFNSKDLTPLEFGDKLKEFNLSIEDLKEIGVSEDFINPMKENLLNTDQINKLIEFKKSLKKP